MKITHPIAASCDEEVLNYFKTLKPGEEVIEIGQSCMFGKRGVVYLNKDGDICVRWKISTNGDWMGTSVTWGTRRVSEVSFWETE